MSKTKRSELKYLNVCYRTTYGKTLGIADILVNFIGIDLLSRNCISIIFSAWKGERKGSVVGPLFGLDNPPLYTSEAKPAHNRRRRRRRLVLNRFLAPLHGEWWGWLLGGRGQSGVWRWGLGVGKPESKCARHTQLICSVNSTQIPRHNLHLLARTLYYHLKGFCSYIIPITASWSSSFCWTPRDRFLIHGEILSPIRSPLGDWPSLYVPYTKGA